MILEDFNFYEEQVRKFILEFEKRTFIYWENELEDIVDINNKTITKHYEIDSIQKEFNYITNKCIGLSEETMIELYKIPLINRKKLFIYRQIINHIIQEITLYEDLNLIDDNNFILLVEDSKEMRHRLVMLKKYGGSNILWMPQHYLKNKKFILCEKVGLISLFYSGKDFVDCVFSSENEK